MMVIIMKSLMGPCIAVFNIHVFKISLSMFLSIAIFSKCSDILLTVDYRNSEHPNMHNILIPDICHGHTDGVRGEKICHVEKCQISVHETCGES